MSRRGPRSSAGDVAEYDDGPSRNRWDRERFDFYARTGGGRGGGGGDRELDIRINERRGSPPSHHSPAPAPAPAPPPPAPRRSVVEERERFYERDTYSPPRRRDVYWEEPTPSEVARTALAPYRKKEFIREYEAAPARPSRPGLLRRQSSLDTFDRRPLRYEHEEWRPPAYVPIPLPVRRRDYYDDYEEVRWRERERNRDLSPGWEEEYRDVRVRRRNKSRRRHRSHSVRSASTSSSSSSEDVKSVKSSKTEKSSKTSKSSKTVVETGPPLLGKKGKTRMPKRLVHKQAIMDMSLPFEEEEHFIIVQRALEKEQIDEVIKKSEGYKDTKVTYKYEEVKETVKEDDNKTEIGIPPPPPPITMIPPPPPPGSVHESHHDHSPPRTVFEEKITERIEERSPPPPPITTLERIERIDRRSERSIRDEIRALEAEREALRLERKADRRLLEADRYREGDYEYELVERRSRPVEEVVRVEKDRRGRKAPDPKAVAFAMSTLS